jgi:hypothetical protein
MFHIKRMHLLCNVTISTYRSPETRGGGPKWAGVNTECTRSTERCRGRTRGRCSTKKAGGRGSPKGRRGRPEGTRGRGCSEGTRGGTGKPYRGRAGGRGAPEGTGGCSEWGGGGTKGTGGYTWGGTRGLGPKQAQPPRGLSAERACHTTNRTRPKTYTPSGGFSPRIESIHRSWWCSCTPKQTPHTQA